MNKRIALLSLSVFIMGISGTYGQKHIDTEHLKSLLSDSLYSGHVIVNEHWRGKLHERTFNYLENQEFELSVINFHKNSQGDFNKNGIPDLFATMQIKQRSRNEVYLCLVEFDNEIATEYSYFEMGLYSQVKINAVKNDTLKVRTQMWGRNQESYLDRIVALVHDEQNILRIVTPNKLDDMKDVNIFKTHLDHIKRESFISNQVVKKQSEEYHKDNLSILAELSGFNDLNLRFTITKRNLNSNFDKINFINEMFEFLQSNTRFPSILTRIEKVILIKNEEGLAISNDFKYDIKNYISPNAYFTIGEHQRNEEYFIFDLFYIENENN